MPPPVLAETLIRERSEVPGKYAPLGVHPPRRVGTTTPHPLVTTHDFSSRTTEWARRPPPFRRPARHGSRREIMSELGQVWDRGPANGVRKNAIPRDSFALPLPLASRLSGLSFVASQRLASATRAAPRSKCSALRRGEKHTTQRAPRSPAAVKITTASRSPARSFQLRLTPQVNQTAPVNGLIRPSFRSHRLPQVRAPWIARTRPFQVALATPRSLRRRRLARTKSVRQGSAGHPSAPRAGRRTKPPRRTPLGAALQQPLKALWFNFI
jgi:hypothetical protein